MLRDLPRTGSNNHREMDRPQLLVVNCTRPPGLDCYILVILYCESQFQAIQRDIQAATRGGSDLELRHGALLELRIGGCVARRACICGGGGGGGGGGAAGGGGEPKEGGRERGWEGLIAREGGGENPREGGYLLLEDNDLLPGLAVACLTR